MRPLRLQTINLHIISKCFFVAKGCLRFTGFRHSFMAHFAFATKGRLRFCTSYTYAISILPSCSRGETLRGISYGNDHVYTAYGWEHEIPRRVVKPFVVSQERLMAGNQPCWGANNFDPRHSQHQKLAPEGKSQDCWQWQSLKP